MMDETMPETIDLTPHWSGRETVERGWKPPGPLRPGSQEEVDMGIAGRRLEIYAVGKNGCEGSEYLHALIFNALDTLEPQGDTSDRLRQWLRSAPAIGDTLEADCGACEPITRIA